MVLQSVVVMMFFATAKVVASEMMVLTVPLSDNTNLVLSPVGTQFSCVNKTYGYYADMEAACKVYHICNPYVTQYGQEQAVQYSFYCREERIFSQATLTCELPHQGIPCEQAYLYYPVPSSVANADQDRYANPDQDS
ncbi:uncharacterized protein LOC106467860 [Limulus polyphemus]|uniref:Uncharacterized protein LOC106467860 n=1 Tax=Limulus polyphemus TaxID=6850 RepID=A0ABM1BKB2_LIMPO|nr:uncharacterized protein LOC106467860 [Limulus polyphemus]